MIVAWLAFLFMVTITVMAVSARKKIREKDVALNISAAALDEALERQAKDADTIIELRADAERYVDRAKAIPPPPPPLDEPQLDWVKKGAHVKKPRKKG